MLTMIDSNMSTGGVEPAFYNVTGKHILDGNLLVLYLTFSAAGNSQSCLYTPPPASSLASIEPNVTDVLTTCQPWGLTVKGGTKPYQIVLEALNSPVITNVTMGPDDDVFTFIDRADPNGYMMGMYLYSCSIGFFLHSYFLICIR